MSAEISNNEKNTLGLVALILAIIGLLLTISIFGSILGIPLLCLALILGIIALFRRPRGNAVASVIISILPLGFLVYLAAVFGSIIIQPTFEFVKEIQADYAQNPLMQEVIEQPGFDRFFQNRLESRFKSINRQDITLTTKGSPKQQMQYYIAFTLNEVRAEIPETLNAWIAQYGLPENSQDFSGPETV
ncbi:hypothetical protein FACS189428_2360 [Clostridia bacterium]|nr:hypothetical protein FACS189428_2360 [Clostridia bacterium]